MATSLFIRAPFVATPATTLGHYTITDDFLTSGRLLVDIDAGESERLELTPAFPGTLTFKPHEIGGAPAPNPADPAADPIAGDLFLELSDPAPFRKLAAIAHFAYPVLLAYLDVVLTPSFFQGTVVAGRIVDPLKRLPRRPGAAQKAHAFAKGEISVQVSPTRSESGCVMPSLAPLDNAAVAPIAFRFGVRTSLNPLAPQPSLAALPAASILAAPNFVPMPLAFFYGMLRRLPGHWTELAADGHGAHPFFDALEALEDNTFAGRWRRLRVFPPGNRTTTPLPSGSMAMLEARATDSFGELWRRPVNQLGEVFVKRHASEAFDLTLVDRPATANQPVEISEFPEDDPAPSLSLQWGGTPDAGDAGLDVTAHLPVDGDPTDTTLFFMLMQGMRDQAGITVDPVLNGVVSERRLVRPLQHLLAQLGFALVGTPRDTFDQATAWALREFQLYARLPRVATLDGPLVLRHAERLVATDNAQPYTGEITGILDANTAAALRVWRDHGYVCPVVVESWQMSSGTRTAVARENIWLPTDDTASAHRVFASDVSGYYDLPSSRPANEIILGRYASLDGHDGILCAKTIGTSWTPDTDVTPDRLVGPASGARSAETISTYKVIAALAKAENEGVFDVLNGYDRGVMSLGVCHWILYLPPHRGALEGAELPAFLAYLARTEPVALERFFAAFGILPDTIWPDGPATGNPLYMSDQAKWVANVLLRGLGASKTRYPDSEPQTLTTPADANYLRTWHWCYRWIMASRTSEAVQRRQWDLARLRVGQLLATPWKASKDAQHFTSIGQVFSSERAIAALLRAHVNQPAHVVRRARASDRLLDAVKQAGLHQTKPADWTPAQFALLYDRLEGQLKAINGPINDTLDLATGYVDASFGALSDDKNSFRFDAAGL